MNKKVRKILELDKILEKLSEFAVMNKTKEALLKIEPSSSLSEVEKLLNETDEGRVFAVKHSRPPVVPLSEIGAAVKRLKIGATLSCGELLAVGHVLRSARTIIKYFSVDNFEEQFPLLLKYKNLLYEDKLRENKIFSCILSDSEIDDNASLKLSEIRRKKMSLQNKVKDILQEIIHSPSYAKALQEPIVSMRGDRYVVPVKSEYKSSIGGVVHDTSQSGGTLFVEPMKVVETNNKIRELAADEKEEIERILAEISGEIAEIADNLTDNFEIISHIDFIFAKAAYADSIEAAKPQINDKNIIDIKDGRHPLIDKKKVVPINIRLGEDFDTLVITGPNTGGKTVSLKTLGLFSLMAQCGLHTPCRESSRLCIFDEIFADIGDEQSIEQSLSTFSSHMVNIVGILKNCGKKSLVLFDELGAGTDPAEGAALATAILKNVRAKGALVAATTHYSEIKMYALSTPGVENAACEFDVNSLKPTYRLYVGALGKSCAFDIAKRLGIADSVIDEARGLVDAENTQFEDIVSKLEKNRIKAENVSKQAERDRQMAQSIKDKLKAEDEKQKKMRDRILDEARREAKKMLEDAKSEISEKMREIERAAKGTYKEKARAMQEARTSLGKNIGEIDDKLTRGLFKTHKNPKPEEIKIGMDIYLPAMSAEGEVLSLPDKNGNLEVMVGGMKIKTKLSTIEIMASKPKKQEPKTKIPAAFYKGNAVKSEIDLRGMILDDAIAAVDKYLDDAVMSHHNVVTIIHGRGTGVLKAGITEFLKSNRSVKSFRMGALSEGGDGVTVVELK